MLESDYDDERFGPGTSGMCQDDDPHHPDLEHHGDDVGPNLLTVSSPCGAVFPGMKKFNLNRVVHKLRK